MSFVYCNYLDLKFKFVSSIFFKKMQREVSNRIQLGQDLNSLNNVSAILSIDIKQM